MVNDNHMDNYLKEILAFVYYDSIVNNRPKNGTCCRENAVGCYREVAVLINTFHAMGKFSR